jgi:hypothetical protein
MKWIVRVTATARGHPKRSTAKMAIFTLFSKLHINFINLYFTFKLKLIIELYLLLYISFKKEKVFNAL